MLVEPDRLIHRKGLKKRFVEQGGQHAFYCRFKMLCPNGLRGLDKQV